MNNTSYLISTHLPLTILHSPTVHPSSLFYYFPWTEVTPLITLPYPYSIKAPMQEEGGASTAHW